MRPRPRAVAALLVLAAALPALSSCTTGDDRALPGPSAARDVEADPVLRVAVAGVASLDPALTNPASPSQTVVADLLYDGLTAYDTQRIKADYLEFAYAEGTDEAGKRSVFDALGLYLNFVNLFQLLLQFMGVRQNSD